MRNFTPTTSKRSLPWYCGCCKPCWQITCDTHTYTHLALATAAPMPRTSISMPPSRVTDHGVSKQTSQKRAQACYQQSSYVGTESQEKILLFRNCAGHTHTHTHTHGGSIYTPTQLLTKPSVSLYLINKLPLKCKAGVQRNL